MSFVPLMVASTHTPRAQELARQVAGVVREYRSTHPDMTDLEVNTALSLAQAQSRGEGSSSAAPAALIAASVGLVLAAGLGALLAARADGGSGSSPWIAMAIGGIVVLLAVALLIIRLRRG